MEKFKECPSCGNSKSGSKIFRCTNCNKIYCEKCGSDRFGDLCPKCDQAGTPRGEIK